MSAADLLSANPLLSDRVRLTIMANLSLAKGSVDFNTLLAELALTRGNLSTHLRKLEEAGLIATTKGFVDRKPRSTYTCTNAGKEAIKSYLAAVEAVLKKVQ